MSSVAAPMQDVTPLQVLLVCPRGEHLRSLRGLASRWPQSANVQWTPDPEDAFRRAQECPPHLVILDARLDRSCESALSERLRRGRPDLVVMNFDEPVLTRDQSRCSHWHWSELPRAMDWWMRRHLDVRSRVRANPPSLQ